jgi:hypothetical protein
MMKRVAFGVLLLLLSASVDDVWAAATPELSDDEVAAENDEYLPAVPREDPSAAARKLLQPSSLRSASSLTGPAVASSPNRHAPLNPSPDLLYLLLSLRC